MKICVLFSFLIICCCQFNSQIQVTTKDSYGNTISKSKIEINKSSYTNPAPIIDKSHSIINDAINQTQQNLKNNIIQNQVNYQNKALRNEEIRIKKEEAFKNNNSVELINIDFLNSHSNYKYIFLRDIFNHSYFQSLKNNSTDNLRFREKVISELKSCSELEIVNIIGNKNMITHRGNFAQMNKVDGLLYLDIKYVAETIDEKIILNLTDNQNTNILNLIFHNKSLNDALLPICNIESFKIIIEKEKEEAKIKNEDIERAKILKKIREYKELLDLKVITEKEYQEKIENYKKILLN